MIRLDGIWAAYKKDSYILRDVCMAVKTGDSCAVVGPSGSGKSTLLKLMNGMMVPHRGTVMVDEKRPVRRDRMFRSERSSIGYIPQNLGLVRNSTVMDNVMMGALPRMAHMKSLLKRYPVEEVENAHRILERVGLEDKADRNVYNLSGGERRRVAIARAFMQKPKILLADEMVSELDTTTSRIIMNMVREEQQSTGLTAIIIHHNLELAVEFANTIVLIKDGQKLIELSNQNNKVVDFTVGDMSRQEILAMYDDAK